LVVHLLLGYRQLRDLRYYADDPLVKRTLGLRQGECVLARNLKSVKEL
jgi:hypothetical protein